MPAYAAQFDGVTPSLDDDHRDVDANLLRRIEDQTYPSWISSA